METKDTITANAPTLGTLGLASYRHSGPQPDFGTRVTGLAVDSRKVRPGFVFIAVPGTNLDGADFIQFALRQEALAIVCSPAGLARAALENPPAVPVFLSDDPRRAVAQLAAKFYGRQPPNMVAVTGTNGKTSSAHFVYQIWRQLGYRGVVFGTAGIEGTEKTVPAAMTTPEPIGLHALLAALADEGCTHAAMEASSHGLAQHRLDGVQLQAGGLSNITRDHLDYHSDAAAYIAAKMRLFTELLPPGGTMVYHRDGDMAADMAAIAKARNLHSITWGQKGGDLRILSHQIHQEGQKIRFAWKDRVHASDLRLIGRFQVDNVLLAAGLAIGAGADPQDVFGTFDALRGVRGRMELAARRANGAAIYVDYAHTPDALAVALQALRPHCPGKLVVVFGAGGDRDQGKRPLMGQAAARYADLVFVTDDNPRNEDPAAIRAMVCEGCPRANNIPDRTSAILAGTDALDKAEDCLLIAGKGHEQGQEIGGEIRPFDDVLQAQAAVAALDESDAILPNDGVRS